MPQKPKPPAKPSKSVDEQHVDQIKVEIRVLEGRRGEIRGEIQAVTDKMLADRQEQLDHQLAEHDRRVKELTDRASELVKDVERLETSQHEQATRLSDLDSEVEQRRRALTQLLEDEKLAIGRLEVSRSQLEAVESQVGTLNGQIEPLQNQIEALKGALEQARGEHSEATAAITAEITALIEKKSGLEREIGSLQARKRELAVDVSGQIEEMKQAREDLAAGWQMLEEGRRKLEKDLRELRRAQGQVVVGTDLLNL